MTNETNELALHPLVKPLTLAGALPFVGCAIGAWRLWPLYFDPIYVVVVYSAVILSFLGGIQWSLFLTGSSPKSWVIITSNILALLGWLCVLFFTANPSAICILLASAFGIALWVDSCLWRQGYISASFYKLRTSITGIVVTCLLVTALAQIFAVAEFAR